MQNVLTNHFKCNILKLHRKRKKEVTTLQLNLKGARANKNLTQAEAAKLIGVTKDTIGNWERGESAPSVKYISKITETYEINYDELIFCPNITLKE